MYAFKVIYNQKNLDKNSKSYGFVSFDKTKKFESLQDAFKFVHKLKNTHTGNYEVIGIPVIESL